MLELNLFGGLTLYTLDIGFLRDEAIYAHHRRYSYDVQLVQYCVLVRSSVLGEFAANPLLCDPRPISILSESFHTCYVLWSILGARIYRACTKGAVFSPRSSWGSKAKAVAILRTVRP